jgi:hypothetical protein
MTRDPIALQCSFLGVPCTLHIEMDSFYGTTIQFIYNNKQYTFEITSWSRGATTYFQKAFLEYYTPPISADFGSKEDPTTIGQPQTRRMILQACCDVLYTIANILSVHGKGISDYAQWYRERRSQNRDSYEARITLIACNCIIHSEFTAPNVIWTLVEFNRRPI